MATDQLLYLKTTAPTTGDDSDDGYKVLDIWGDTTNDLIYQAIDVSVGAAVWIEMVGRTLTQTLTNKTISLASNTITGTTAEFNTALSDGNFATLAGTEILSGKTLTLPQINDTSSDHQYVVAVNELSADRTVTLPLLTTADEFTFNAHAQTLTNKTLTSPVITTPQINDTSLDHQYVFVPSELAADRNVTLPLLGASDEFTFNAHTQTLTNKRVTPRVTSETSSATPTINTDNSDAHSITALAAAITSMTSGLSGTPTNFQKLTIRIKDNGTARAITWGASFEAKGVALPTTTVISKVLTVGFIYDTVSAKWGCVASAQES